MSTPNHSPRPKNQFEVIQLALRAAYLALSFAEQEQIRAENERARADRQEKASKELQKLAQLDPLTGLRNRRALADDYSRLQAAATRQGRRSDGSQYTHALLLGDVDHFKSINDNYGHDAGDTVLKGVGEVMRQTVRRRDVVARWGGEEFALLLPRASEKVALRVAGDVRENITASNLLGEVDPARMVTMSMGLAMVDLRDDLDVNMARADLALYVAKERGRNQVVSASHLNVELAAAVPNSIAS